VKQSIRPAVLAELSQKHLADQQDRYETVRGFRPDGSKFETLEEYTHALGQFGELSVTEKGARSVVERELKIVESLELSDNFSYA